MIPETSARGLPDPDMQPEFYASVPVKRLVAWVVDSLLIGGLTLLIVPLTGFVALFFLPMLFLVVGVAYRWVTLTRSSATPGMRLVAIEFRDADGRRLDGAMALVHTLGFTLSMAFVLPQVVSVVLMLTGARAQGLTDVILGTAAINRPSDLH